MFRRRTFLMLVCISGLSLCLFVLSFGLGHWDGSWGPARFVVKLKDSRTGTDLGAEDCVVVVDRWDPYLYKVTKHDGAIELMFPRVTIGGTMFWLRRTGTMRFWMQFDKAGYVPKRLNYPHDFEIAKRPSGVKAPVEAHEGTLLLDRVNRN
jgi:hypothetical protein